MMKNATFWLIMSIFGMKNVNMNDKNINKDVEEHDVCIDKRENVCI